MSEPEMLYHIYLMLMSRESPLAKSYKSDIIPFV
jgi:hypothetical protein